MSDERNWLLKMGGWVYFESCDISQENIPILHTVSLALFMCACSDFAMPLLSCTCLCNNSKLCLPSFVSPSSATVLLLRCFLLNITACTVMGILLEEKHPLQELHSNRLQYSRHLGYTPPQLLIACNMQTWREKGRL